MSYYYVHFDALCETGKMPFSSRILLVSLLHRMYNISLIFGMKYNSFGPQLWYVYRPFQPCIKKIGIFITKAHIVEIFCLYIKVEGRTSTFSLYRDIMLVFEPQYFDVKLWKVNRLYILHCNICLIILY